MTCICYTVRITINSMNRIKAVGFDLFNTLITVEPQALDEAENRLVCSLRQEGLAVEREPFKQVHREAALRFIRDAQRDGRETHNRFWIRAALKRWGYSIAPNDPRIALAVDAYFSAFLPFCHLIPGTRDMFGFLKGKYRLGLLSNFTHAPAALDIINKVGLTPFFDVVLISGALGYRKPHPLTFRRLIEQLAVDKNEILYVGDDPEPDITGAQRAGIRPVWTTYVRDQHIPPAPGVLSRSSQKADRTVPRISAWKELITLLENG
jgi:putative hydrolase of the HAD superfamily